MLETARIKQLLIFMLMALLTYSVWQFSFVEVEESKFKPFTKGYSVSDVLLEITDENGQITTVINSPLLLHYADTEITEISKPQVVIKAADGKKWIFESDKGQYIDSRFELFFPGDVVVQNDALDIEKKITLNTSALTVNTENQTAQSEAFIEIKQNNMFFNGVGSFINFSIQEIEVKSNVHAEFDN